MIGFDNDKYVELQSKKILERIDSIQGRLYLEFGGKLFDDYHAARVLPGFHADTKIRLLETLKDKAEILFVISAKNIESSKVRADLGITYDMDVLRLTDNMRRRGLKVSNVVITQYEGQKAADVFAAKLESLGLSCYIHGLTRGYPTETELIVSDEGYGENPYIETTMPLVVVTAPGPGSGKLATCLSQLYHEYKRGQKAGYAKFETFPIWNLPLKHPVNLAYEAATADLNDVNMIDSFHLEAYGKIAVNYNRDIDAFPIVKNILAKITGDENYYRSPTDMGVNMAGYAITNDAVVSEAARQEVIRRYFNAACDYKMGRLQKEALTKITLLMKQMELEKSDRGVVAPALLKAEQSGTPSAALKTSGGEIITGRTTDIMDCCASVLLNSIKRLAGISDEIKLISPIALEPILKLKKETLGERDPLLSAEDVLIALGLSAAFNPTAEHAMEKLPCLSGCELHCSCMVSSVDSSILKKLHINVTCEPEYPTSDLYFK